MRRFVFCAAAFAILLLICASCAAQSETTVVFDGEDVRVSGNGAQADGSVVRIRRGGTYTIRGATVNGALVVEAPGAAVTLILDGAEITSADSAAICVADARCATVVAADGSENVLTDAAGRSTGKGAPNACLYADADLILSGGGSLTVNGLAKNGVTAARALMIETLRLTVDAQNDGLHAGGSVRIRSGGVRVRCGDDAIHADEAVEIEDGEIAVSGREGIEGNRVTVDGGTIGIRASDDGINAGRKGSDLTPRVTINGGDVTIEMEPGDTDGVDSNGDLIVNGGTLRVTAQNPFDFDGRGVLRGGTVYVNGERIEELSD